MRKFIYPIIILSLAGIIISAVLLTQHFFPENGVAAQLCGDGLKNTCLSLSLSPYSTFLDIPVAAYGMFFYLFMLFMLMVSDYARDIYLDTAVSMTLIMSVLAVIVDIILAITLFITDHYCSLCVYTYVINVLILILAVLLFRERSRNDQYSIISSFKNIIPTQQAVSHHRAAASLSLLFVILLGYGLISTTWSMEAGSKKSRVSQQQIHSFIAKFYRSKTENLQLPPSSLELGVPGAKIKIIAFTDFLCSACYKFYKIEKYLFARFPDQIDIVYYNYPLDQACNSSVKRTVYRNSCIASKAMMAAKKLGIYRQYLIRHFEKYKYIKKRYSSNEAVKIFKELSDEGIIEGYSVQDFVRVMNSEETMIKILEHIEAGTANGINATPTFFISGRKFIGVPPKELLAAVIARELKRLK